MTRPVAVLRPEPGNARTAAALRAAGLKAIRLPLFAVVPLAWEPPDPAGFDALVATSANAFRHGGAGLARLTTLPVHAVGEATATAARAAGFRVASTGSRDAAALAATIPAGLRLLHLAGRERTGLADVPTVTLYATDPLPVAAAAIALVRGGIALLHSARAARRWAALVPAADRATITLAALAAPVAAAAGDGWRSVAVAACPTDAALVALAARAAE